MPIWAIIVIIIAAVIVVALVATMALRQRRTAALRGRFGAEYDRAVESRDDQRSAEAALRDRERQRARLDIKPLPEAVRVRYADEWRTVQERFVDHPADAVAAADDLLHRVMSERGYPTGGDFDAQADLVSVDHPDVVENYRIAHGIHQRTATQQASTEDLREALLRYRSLFEELLRPGDEAAATGAATSTRQETVTAPAQQEATATSTGQGLRAGGVRDVTDEDVQTQGAGRRNTIDREADDDAR
jgi:hypothetical protein